MRIVFTPGTTFHTGVKCGISYLCVTCIGALYDMWHMNWVELVLVPEMTVGT